MHPQDHSHDHGHDHPHAEISQAGQPGYYEIMETAITTGLADSLRREISLRIGANSPFFWLTVDFTADRHWM